MVLTPMKLSRFRKKGQWPQPQQALCRTRSANAWKKDDEKRQWEDKMSAKAKFAAITCGLVIGLSGMAHAAWQPAKPIECIATAGPGGGTDNFAPAVHDISTKHKLVDEPIVGTNKRGGDRADGKTST